MKVAVLLAAGLVAGSPSPAALRKNLLRLGARPGDRSFVIPTPAMEPTLRCTRGKAPGCSGTEDDRVVVRPYGRSRPRRGDIVVFRTPRASCGSYPAGEVFVKRVVGLPGETVSVQSGLVVVDGKRLAEPYARRDSRSAIPHDVGRGSYFVLGDTRAESCDSRAFGEVPRKNVIGRVIGIYWPSNRVHRL